MQIEIYRRSSLHVALRLDQADAVLNLESVGLTMTLADVYE
jgi:hypothetical protein